MRDFKPDQSEIFLGEVGFIRLKNAGVAETINIPIPRGTRNVTWAYVVLLNAAQVNRLDLRYVEKSTEGTIDLDAIPNIFNALGVGTTVTAGGANTHSAIMLRWQIQANAAAQTRFYLHLKFFST